MWVARKSSNREIAPGARSPGVLEGLDWRHLTASMYSVRSATVKLPLNHMLMMGKDSDRCVYMGYHHLPFSSNLDIVPSACASVESSRCDQLLRRVIGSRGKRLEPSIVLHFIPKRRLDQYGCQGSLPRESSETHVCWLRDGNNFGRDIPRCSNKMRSSTLMYSFWRPSLCYFFPSGYSRLRSL